MEKKEAMQILKDFHDKSALFSVRTALDTIIPELKESDERIRKAIMEFFELQDDNTTYSLIPKKDILAWLEKQDEQKPAWSEEDEIALSDALWVIKQARTIAKDENDMGNLWYAERWLKSLKERYTWKPSDEQMGTLEQWLKDNQYKGNAKYCYPIFESLYQDLKKLRE